MSEISLTKEEALMRIDTLRMAYICDPQECGKKDGYDKDHFLCRGCDETYEALAIATKALEKEIERMK